MNEKQINDFLFAGNATFTLKSAKTGNHISFNVSKGKKDPETFFVHDPSGKAVGTIKNKKWNTWNKGKSEAFGWWWYHMDSEQVELYHVGKCGRCNRPLTDPTSIERGIGPDCYKLLGLDIPDMNIEDLFK